MMQRREKRKNRAEERAREGNIPLTAGEKRLMKELHWGPRGELVNHQQEGESSPVTTPAAQSEPVAMFPNKLFETQWDRWRVWQKKKKTLRSPTLHL